MNSTFYQTIFLKYLLHFHKLYFIKILFIIRDMYRFRILPLILILIVKRNKLNFGYTFRFLSLAY